jgi:hypothetical protein
MAFPFSDVPPPQKKPASAIFSVPRSSPAGVASAGHRNTFREWRRKRLSWTFRADIQVPLFRTPAQVHQVRPPRCRCATELDRAAAGREPDGKDVSGEWDFFTSMRSRNSTWSASSHYCFTASCSCSLVLRSVAASARAWHSWALWRYSSARDGVPDNARGWLQFSLARARSAAGPPTPSKRPWPPSAPIAGTLGNMRELEGRRRFNHELTL